MTVRKLLTGAVAVLAAAALTSVAFAVERPDDRAGAIGVGAVAAAAQPVRPDDQAGVRGVGSLPSAVPFTSIGSADTVQARLDSGLDAYGSPTIVEPVADTPLVDWTHPFTIALVGALAVILGGAAMLAIAEAIRHGGGHGPGRPAATH